MSPASKAVCLTLGLLGLAVYLTGCTAISKLRLKSEQAPEPLPEWSQPARIKSVTAQALEPTEATPMESLVEPLVETPVEMLEEAHEEPPEAAEAVMAEATDPPASPVAASSMAIWLRLGAFARREPALALLEQAKARFSEDFPGTLVRDASGLYAVQVGPLLSEDAVFQAAAIIRRDLGVQPEQTPPLDAISPAPGLFLQLAAMSSPEAASTLATRVKSRFGRELPGLIQVPSGRLVKLLAGPFATPEAAEHLAQACRLELGIKPFKVRHVVETP